MKANTALAFALAGAALWLLLSGHAGVAARRVARLGAAAVALLGLLTLSEYLFSFDLGIDQALFEEPAGTPGTVIPGRMAPTTALNFLLLGLALLLLDAENRRLRPSQILALLAALVSFLAFIGYVLRVQSLYGIAGYTQMALHTSVIFLLLTTGVLVARPHRGLTRILTSDHLGGVIARWLLPAALLLPLVVGWLRLSGQYLGFYDTEFGLSLIVVFMVVGFSALVWWVTQYLDRVDIERQHTEERMRGTAQTLDAIIQASPLAIYTVDLERRAQSWNPAAERMYGWSAAEIIGHPLPTLLAEGEEELDAVRVRALQGETITGWETRRRRKDGTILDVSVAIAPLRSPSGEVAGLLSIGEDITDRKRAEEEAQHQSEALRASEKLLASIYVTLPDPLYLLGVDPDDQFRFVSINEAFLQATGLTRDQIVGQRVVDVLPPSSHALVIGKYKEAIASGQTVRWEEVAIFPAGKRVGAVSITPIQDGSGSVSRLVGSVRDITQEREAQEALAALNAELEQRVTERTVELEAAVQELEAFSYSVSHDLRAPLRATDGFSRILMEEYGPQLQEEAQRYLRIVRDNAQQMGHLIDDLLAFSRLSRQPLAKQPVTLTDIAKQALADLQAEQQDRQVEITLATLPPCQADPALMRQVMVNLLSNALKFTRRREEARIEMGSLEEGGECVYFVRDNGAGFDMRYADKLFGVFQRLHRAEEYEGTGVGLAIVQRIIHRHGGRVWAEAEPDKGATFFFTL